MVADAMPVHEVANVNNLVTVVFLVNLLQERHVVLPHARCVRVAYY